jgi:hypothetical protein
LDALIISFLKICVLKVDLILILSTSRKEPSFTSGSSLQPDPKVPDTYVLIPIVFVKSTLAKGSITKSPAEVVIDCDPVKDKFPVNVSPAKEGVAHV